MSFIIISLLTGKMEPEPQGRRCSVNPVIASLYLKPVNVVAYSSFDDSQPRNDVTISYRTPLASQNDIF